MQADQWQGFVEGNWTHQIDVRDFIQHNYTPYEGEASFLAGPTDRTRQLWDQVTHLMAQEREQGVLDVDTQVPRGSRPMLRATSTPI